MNNKLSKKTFENITSYKFIMASCSQLSLVDKYKSAFPT